MGSQQLLAIGSIFLVTMLALNFFTSNINQLESSISNEAFISATGIAQGMIDNILTRAFDEKTVSGSVSATSALTSSGNLGPDASENNVYKFDDIDDFKNYSTIDSSTRLSNYNISVDVNYVVNLNPENNSLSATFAKRIDVSIWGLYLSDTLTLSHITTY